MIKNITLYRPTGANELELIIDSGMKRFPPRLYWQPIFYPVLNFHYAAEIAERWNMRDALSDDVGFVTAFEIPEAYFTKFQVQTVGLDHHHELWIPAEQLDEFNNMIVNGIRVERHFSEVNTSLLTRLLTCFLVVSDYLVLIRNGSGLLKFLPNFINPNESN